MIVDILKHWVTMLALMNYWKELPMNRKETTEFLGELLLITESWFLFPGRSGRRTNTKTLPS